MLAGLATWILNNYLGKYVEDLNTDQLSIAVLSGEVELENLPLRTDALKHLGAPVEVRAGHIGKVKLQIPVRQLRTAPWVIVIERLYIVAGPVPSDDTTGERAAAERLAAHDRKLATLDAIEACWRVETDSRSVPGYYATSYTSWLSYGTGVITDIMENLQLNVVDVHIRYEDSTSIPNVAAACGLTIGALTAHTCDENWLPSSYSQTADHSQLSFKLLELKELAVYWDWRPLDQAPAFLVSEGGAADLAGAMGPRDRVKRYVVAPVNASARLQRNRSEKPLRGANQPRFVCHLKLDEVPLSLDDVQHDQIIGLSRGLELSAQAQTRRALRPATPPTQDARRWWQYAARRLVPHLRVRASLEASAARATDNVRYVQLYGALLQRPVGVLPPADRAFKDRFEWERDLSELQALREVAMRKTPPSLPNPGATRGLGTLVHWFPQWCGWRQAVAVDGGGVASEGPPRQLEEEILAVLADSALDSTVLRRDALFGRFNFELTSGAFKLCESRNSISTTMLEFEFSGLCLSLEWRPRSSALTVELSIGGICLRDNLTVGSLFPVLVGAPETERQARGRRQQAPQATAGSYQRKPRRSLYAAGASQAVGAPLFELVYTCGGPLERRLHVRSRPLDVVYQPAAARWLLEFMCAPHQRASARQRLRDVGARTRHGLAAQFTHVLGGRAPGAEARRPQWQVRLDVSAPQLILVERFTDPDSAIAVLDFGRLRLRSGGGGGDSDEPSPCSDDERNKLGVKKGSSVEPAEEDEEEFMTPCSTPPGSEASAESDTYTTVTTDAPSKRTVQPTLSSDSLRQKLYEIYRVDLTDIQVLIGRARDDWRRAHTRGASSLHVLDRASLALVVERRLVHTSDATYPSLAVSGTLPRLGAHLNEQKVESARALLRMLHDTGLPSPLHHLPPDQPAPDQSDQPPTTPPPSSPPPQLDTAGSGEPGAGRGSGGATAGGPSEAGSGRLVAIRWVVERLCLALEARERCVAELQVSRVALAVAARPHDTSASLSVHGLLLVDALQTHGPDFELLAASHPHVEMDSVSGRLLDSEPTSPSSPASPDASALRSEALAPPPPPPHPAALSRALSGLESWYSADSGGALLFAVDDVQDALISVEAVWVSAPEPFHYVNVQCNNLDITANQETIVELVTFVRRVMPAGAGAGAQPEPTRPQQDQGVPQAAADSDGTVPQVRSEVTFDFQRLTVLLLRRAASPDGRAVGKKVATATALAAKVHSTTWKDGTSWLRASLAGLQVVDLTTEAGVHRRIISAGLDPLSDDPFDAKQQQQKEEEGEAALSFRCAAAGTNVSVHNLWYTHSADFLAEVIAAFQEFNAYMHMSASSKSCGVVASGPPVGHYKCDVRRLRVVLPTRRADLVLLATVTSAVLAVQRGFLKTVHATGLHVDMVHVRCASPHPGRGVRRASDLYERAATSEPLLHDASLHIVTTWRRDDSPTETCTLAVSVPQGLQLTLLSEQLPHVRYVLDNLTSWNARPVAHVAVDEPDSLYHLADFRTLKLEPEIVARLEAQATPESTPQMVRIMHYQVAVPSIDVDLRVCSAAVSVTVSWLRVSYERRPDASELRASVQYVRADRSDKPGHQLLSVQTHRRAWRAHLSRSCPANGPVPHGATFGGSLPNSLSSHHKAEHSSANEVYSSEDEAYTPIGDDALQISCDMYNNRKEISVEIRRLDVNLSRRPWRDLLDLCARETDDEPDESAAGAGVGVDRQNDWCVNVRELVVTGGREGRDVARLRAHHVTMRINNSGALQLGRVYVRRLALADLTRHAHCLDTRFEALSSRRAACALDARYERPAAAAAAAAASARVRIDLAPFVYVHTARFYAELSALLQELLETPGDQVPDQGTTVALRLSAESSLLLLPGDTNDNLVLGLPIGRLVIDGEPDAPTSLSFDDIEMYAYRVEEARKAPAEMAPRTRRQRRRRQLLGSKELVEDGPMLLANRLKLDFTVIRRKWTETSTPKVRVSGRLSAFEMTLSEAQTTLLGAVLYRNLGDDTTDIQQEEEAASDDHVLAVRVDVPSVLLHLENWCRVHLDEVRLLAERRSGADRSSGLVCGRATVTDTRHRAATHHFLEVLAGCAPATTVAPQLEVHSSARGGQSVRHTLLLNGTRLTLLADWWRDTLHWMSSAPTSVPAPARTPPAAYELRLNATESEVLLVAQPDSATSDALLLRSTTLVTYRANNELDGSLLRSLSSSINECSVLWHPAPQHASPIAGPTAITLELTSDGTLEVQLLELGARLSPGDIAAVLHVLGALTSALGAARAPVVVEAASGPQRLAAMLGFREEDAARALRICHNSVDEAALWLTQHASARAPPPPAPLRTYRVSASRLLVRIVDEVADADVPLGELALSDLALVCHDDGGARLDATLAIDYYNRAMSGWEPLLEPCRCELVLATQLGYKRVVTVRSDTVLDVNVTDELLVLARYLCRSRAALQRTQRARSKRAVFVPYTLRNETGVAVRVCAHLVNHDHDLGQHVRAPSDAPWLDVAATHELGVPFGDEREPRRHGAVRAARVLWVQVCGWRATHPPVAVDRAGVFGRRIEREDELGSTAVLVVDVRPVAGSARHLILVRGALVLVNRLPYAVDVKLEPERRAVSAAGRAAVLKPRRGRFVPPLAVALSAAVYVRPAHPVDAFAYARAVPADSALGALARCATNRGAVRWIWAEVRTFGGARLREREVHLVPGILLVNTLPQELQYMLGTIEGSVPPDESETVPQVEPDGALELRIHLENFACVQPAHIPAAATATATAAAADQHSNSGEGDTMTGFSANGTSASTPVACALERGEEELRLLTVLEDERGRRLQVRVRAERGRGARLRLTVAAPYWLTNRTGLPLVFRQQGAGRDAAGQFAEHEVARMRAPLPFSLSEPEAAAAVEIRIGGGGAGSTQWCRAVHLRPGEHVRRLLAPDGMLYVLGVEVREQRARNTTVVTVSPRHQLYNGTALRLELARWPPASAEGDMGVVGAPPGCHLPYHHWPAEPRLLCVRTDGRSWSGAISVDVSEATACRLALRPTDDAGPLLFLQTEVVPHGAARLVVFSDASALPPPLRVDNWAAVRVWVAQLGVGRPPVAVAAHRSTPYTWDEPTEAARLVVRAPGGAALVCEPDNLAAGTHIQHLAYENFIYIALTATFTDGDSDGTAATSTLKQEQELVLEATESGRIVARRCVRARHAQLWRMTPTGQLQHEGGPAGEPRVLDIATPAPRPQELTALALRRVDQRRKSTQTWHFSADGRLCCAHRHLCVQVSEHVAYLGPCADLTPSPHHLISAKRMRPGSGLLAVDVYSDGATRVVRVVDAREPLGARPLCDQDAWAGVHRALWPHEPTDLQRAAAAAAAAKDDDDDDNNDDDDDDADSLVQLGSADLDQKAMKSDDKDKNELVPSRGADFRVTVHLRAGLGVSLVSRGHELLYVRATDVLAEAVSSAAGGYALCTSVRALQCDNQLRSASQPVVLYTCAGGDAGTSAAATAETSLPALEVRAELQVSPVPRLVLCPHLVLRTAPLALHLDEALLLRVYDMYLQHADGARARYYYYYYYYNNNDDDGGGSHGSAAGGGGDEETTWCHEETGEPEERDEATEVSATSVAASVAAATRYHFGVVRLAPGSLRLGAQTASGAQLSPRLRQLRRRLGLSLVAFEDAPVQLEAYTRASTLETGPRLLQSIRVHFRDELRWQAASILGSVDFLGAPLGLLGDVKAGVSGMIREKSVGALLAGVAHGLSNSAAKVTETLGDGLGRVALLDEAHEEARRRALQANVERGGPSAHLVAGVRGLGFGLLAGATGLFRHAYEGATADGWQGAVAGLGRGLLGAVAKPVVGVLDLATETARAVRDTSRGAGARAPRPRRVRAPRVPRCEVAGRPLPVYNPSDTLGQQLLTNWNRGRELFVAYERLYADLHALLSSECVRVLTRGGADGEVRVVLEAPLADVLACRAHESHGRHYIELTVRGGGGGGGGSSSSGGSGACRKPRVRCDGAAVARSLCRRVAQAKRLQDAALYTLRTNTQLPATD